MLQCQMMIKSTRRHPHVPAGHYMEHSLADYSFW